MVYHTHHRYKRGTSKGHAPLALLSGQALQGDWGDLFLHQVAEGRQVAYGASEPSRSLLELLPNPCERPRPTQRASEPAFVKPAADFDNASTRQRATAASDTASRSETNAMQLPGKASPCLTSTIRMAWPNQLFTTFAVL